tara:strand:- start:3144 stop:3617 length:474 start_codon:yes stop_codon:yes gene_type:complete
MAMLPIKQRKKKTLKSRVAASSKKVKKDWREYAAEKGGIKARKALKKEGMMGDTQYPKGKLGKKSKKKSRVSSVVSKAKSAISEVSQRGRRKKVGASKGTKVRRGAVGVQKTKGGEYVKYKKDSKAAGSFRSAFKKGCAEGASSFTWDGRKYSCKKK